LLLCQRAFGADDALRHRCFGHQKGARNLVCRQSAEQAQSECDSGFCREHRVTGREHQAQEIVADLIVHCAIEIGHTQLLLDLHLVAKLLMLALKHFRAPEPVDGAVFACGHEPGAGIVGNSRLRPAFQCGDESILSQLLRKAHVAHDPCQTGDQLRLLDAEDRGDCEVGVRCRHDIGLEHSLK
jgi:hypothetical protein